MWLILLIGVGLLTGCSKVSEKVIQEDTSSQNKKITNNTDSSVEEAEKTSENTSENAKNNEKHVLIAYFSRIGNIDSERELDAISSASVVTQGDDLLGNTQYMATLIQNITGGDMHFIETSQKYSSEYDSSDDNALDVQAFKETRERARPKLATHVENMDDYDVIFLGFPNWNGDMPMAVYSFLDEYDLAGKKIYLFNSSGGGGVRNAYSEVTKLEPDSTVEQNIYSVSNSQVEKLTDQDMLEWLSEIGFDH